ncbi:hypothetical protein Tco_1436013 [Tanacetum coccineum]
MSHHTLYGVKPILLYAATFKFTRDDLSESALRRNIGDKGNVGSQRKCNRIIGSEMVSNYGVLGEVMLKSMHFGAQTKSSRKSTDLTENTPYYSRPIRRIQDFDESKDHCLTFKNTPYPHQQYAAYNTLVNEEESTGFTSIRRIHQEDTAYPYLHFTNNHEGLEI